MPRTPRTCARAHSCGLTCVTASVMSSESSWCSAGNGVICSDLELEYDVCQFAHFAAIGSASEGVQLCRRIGKTLEKFTKGMILFLNVELTEIPQVLHIFTIQRIPSKLKGEC